MNGWKNRATWNVSLWLQNDESLYRTMRGSKNYDALREELAANGLTRTPDGVDFADPTLDTETLDEMIEESRS